MNDNDFIEIIPDVYANQTSRSSISIEEQKNLENQMVAATYRFTSIVPKTIKDVFSAI